MIESTIPATAKMTIKYGTAVILKYCLAIIELTPDFIADCIALAYIELRNTTQIIEPIKYKIELINPNTPAGLLRINERIAHGI